MRPPSRKCGFNPAIPGKMGGCRSRTVSSAASTTGSTGPRGVPNSPASATGRTGSAEPSSGRRSAIPALTRAAGSVAAPTSAVPGTRISRAAPAADHPQGCEGRLTTVQLMLADQAARRGEAVGVYSPTMNMAKGTGAAVRRLGGRSVVGGEVDRLRGGLRVRRARRLQLGHGQALPAVLVRRLLRRRMGLAASGHAARGQSGGAAPGPGPVGEESQGGRQRHPERLWRRAARAGGRGQDSDIRSSQGCSTNRTRDTTTAIPGAVACTGCGVESPQESWTAGRYSRTTGSMSSTVSCSTRTVQEQKDMHACPGVAETARESQHPAPLSVMALLDGR